MLRKPVRHNTTKVKQLQKSLKKCSLNLQLHTLIENDHLGDRHPEKDCFLTLFRQPVLKPSSESRIAPEDGLRTGCQNISCKQQSFPGLQLFRRSFSIKVCYFCRPVWNGGATGVPTAPHRLQGSTFLWSNSA